MATHARPRAFTTQKKGENYELRSDLNSDNKDKRKDTVKKVIANMTVGKDVSGLFPDVLKNMQTDDLELKKLVYLYLMNYAKTNPELVILAVNTFVKDTDDINPLIRALAIRTMACIRVDKMIDYIGDPLRKCLKDDNPYVRKTAAMCVAKFYDLSPRRTTDDGFVAALQDLMSDSNPMVVANALTSLMEIKEASSKKDIFNVSTSMLNKLLAALNECTEWGQISILTALANYTPQDSKEAETICERVMPRLQHANGSVVLSAVKVLMIYMRVIRNEEFIKQLVKKMAPPLVTLLASAPEVQYVALRNINLILQKRPDILSNEVRVFFCKYNDPPYVKLEKLEVMIKLCSNRNVDQLLSELKEYANEVDVDFVRKSVRAIGRCAIKIDDAAERCVNVLLELISTKVNYVVQEAIVVIKDIFRKYPHKYEGIIPTLCENLDALDEPEAKGSLIWIIGEYAERIENADELIESFMEFFKTENPQVQLQIVSSTVKLFLKKPSQSQEIVQRVLQTATTNCDNPDIRDRAYIYWRLLSTDPQAAKAVVLADKPPIGLETNTVSDALLDELINNISTLASVYHKPPGAFLGNGRIGAAEMQKKAEEENQSDEETEATPGSPRAVRASANVENLLDLDFNTDIPVSGHAPISHPGVSQSKSSSGVDDLLDLLGGPTPAFAPSTDYTLGAGSLNLGGAIGDAARGGFAFPKTVFITAQAGKGLEVSGTFVRRNGVTCLDMSFQNKSMQPMFDFAIQFNKNSFGIASNVPLQVSSPLQPNKASEVSLPLGTSGPVQQMDPFNALQVAVKNNFDVFYFQTLFPIHAFFSEDAGDSSLFSQAWGNPNSAQSSFAVTGLQLASPDALLTALKNNNIFVVDQKGATFHASMKAANVPIAAELLVSQTEIKVSAKSPNAQYLSLLQISLDAILRS